MGAYEKDCSMSGAAARTLMVSKYNKMEILIKKRQIW